MAKIDKDKHLLLDYVLVTIRYKPSSANTCFNDNRKVLSKYNVSTLEILQSVLDILLTDKNIMYSEGIYMPTVQGLFFEGYLKDYKKSKQTTTKEFLWKIIPLIFSVLFGLISAYSGYLNYNLSKATKQKDQIIDSLTHLIPSHKT